MPDAGTETPWFARVIVRSESAPGEPGARRQRARPSPLAALAALALLGFGCEAPVISGVDGCDGSCSSGSCDSSGQCVATCTPSCSGKVCGPDGCGGSCGSCSSGSCEASGQCVATCTPSCSGKVCGPDGCGDSCGSCGSGSCDASGQCVATCAPSCSGKICGPDGCGGTCGPCGANTTCNAAGQCVASQTGPCVGAPNAPGGADPWGGCWPGPHNTGYPHGLPGDTRTPVTLTDYTGPMTITSCGVVIDSKVVDGDIVVSVGNGTHSPNTPCVTIKNSLVKGVIHTDEASFGPVVITDTEVAVAGLGWWENIGRYNIFVWRVDSHGSEGVIKCADYCAAYDSYVHGMRLGGAYHFNAFGGNGMESEGGYFIIDHNWASCGDWESWDPLLDGDAGCSAVIGFYGDFDPIRNITINRNFLAGSRIDSAIPEPESRQPGYCLNPGYYPGKPYPAPTNVAITNNVFGRGYNGKCGVYGPTNSLSAVGSKNGNTWTNNQYEDGALIDWPEE